MITVPSFWSSKDTGRVDRQHRLGAVQRRFVYFWIYEGPEFSRAEIIKIDETFPADEKRWGWLIKEISLFLQPTSAEAVVAFMRAHGGDPTPVMPCWANHGLEAVQLAVEEGAFFGNYQANEHGVILNPSSLELDCGKHAACTIEVAGLRDGYRYSYSASYHQAASTGPVRVSGKIARDLNEAVKLACDGAYAFFADRYGDTAIQRKGKREAQVALQILAVSRGFKLQEPSADLPPPTPPSDPPPPTPQAAETFPARISKTCAACGQVFAAKHPKAVFCSSVCRLRNHRSVKHRAPMPAYPPPKQEPAGDWTPADELGVLTSGSVHDGFSSDGHGWGWLAGEIDPESDEVWMGLHNIAADRKGWLVVLKKPFSGVFGAGFGTDRDTAIKVALKVCKLAILNHSGADRGKDEDILQALYKKADLDFRQSQLAYDTTLEMLEADLRLIGFQMKYSPIMRVWIKEGDYQPYQTCHCIYIVRDERGSYTLAASFKDGPIVLAAAREYLDAVELLLRELRDRHGMNIPPHINQTPIS